MARGDYQFNRRGDPKEAVKKPAIPLVSAGSTVSESDVTAHEAALEINPSQLTNEGSPADGDVLTWDDGLGEYVPAAPPGGGGSINLDDIADVNAPTPADGDVLTYDSATGDWVPEAPPGGGGAIALDDLSDVDATTPADGDVLTYDSGTGDWVPEAPAAPTGGATVAMKTADQATFANVATAISGLSFAIGVSENWQAEFLILFSGDVNTGLGLAFTVPAGATGVMTLQGNNTTVGNLTGFNSTAITTISTQRFGNTTTPLMMVRVTLSIFNGGTGGTVQLVGQSGSATNDITVHAGSYMVAHKV